MLQQTTVKAVIPYYERFIALWPTVQALAAAPQEEVLAAWAGLGYYARARNLHACAQQICDIYDGHFPAQEAELRKLKGVGDYTAAAIAALAFDQQAAVVDGNIERVISRFDHIITPLPQAKKPIKAAVGLYTPKTRCGDFAQALMDLGASLCTPKQAHCTLCPLASLCKAHKTLSAQQRLALPLKAKKIKRPQRIGFALMLQDQAGQIALVRRPDKGLLARTLALPSTNWITLDYHLPKSARAKSLSQAQQQDLIAKLNSQIENLLNQFDLNSADYALESQALKAVDHSFTHFELRLYLAKISLVIANANHLQQAHSLAFHSQDKLATLGLSSLMRKAVLALL